MISLWYFSNLQFHSVCQLNQNLIEMRTKYFDCFLQVYLPFGRTNRRRDGPNPSASQLNLLTNQSSMQRTSLIERTVGPQETHRDTQRECVRVRVWQRIALRSFINQSGIIHQLNVTSQRRGAATAGSGQSRLRSHGECLHY